MVLGAEGRDLIIRSFLLTAKLIAREPQDLETLTFVLLICAQKSTSREQNPLPRSQ